MIIEHKTLTLFGKMVFEKAIIKPPFRMPVPMQNEACFLYVIQGENKAISAVEEVSVFEKEAVLIKCGSYLTQMLPSETSTTYEAVAVHFYPEVLKKVYENDLPHFLKKGKTPPQKSMAKFKTDILLQKYVDSLLFYFSNPELVSEELMILKIKELFLLLEKTKSASAIRDILSTLFSPKTYSFKEIIEAHLFSNLTLDELARLTNLSLSSFKREFKRIYEESPAKYIKNKKLEKAANHLLATDHSISEIAYDCGFNDLAGFSNSFKAKYLTSPSNYRLEKSA
jgi:AraC-like DNA-binding protein